MKFILPAVSAIVVALASSAAGQENHTVAVGKDGLTFEPWNLTAQVGDWVTFVFYAQNHTVTQSTFAEPCTWLQNSTTGATGFDSGFVPVAENATENPAWTIRVTNSTPIWGYCAQGTHCQSGMVFAINAPETGNTADAFMEAAKETSGSADPGSGSGVGGQSTVVSDADWSSSVSDWSSSSSSDAGSASEDDGGSASSISVGAMTSVVGVIAGIFTLVA